MKLFQEIKNDTTDSSTNLADILRKTKIVASLLKNSALKEWVNRELNGYYNIDELEIPEYRKAVGQNYGDFSGPFGSGLKNATIPIMILPDFIKIYASMLLFKQSVSELQSLAQSNSSSFLEKWPPEFIVYIQHNVEMFEDMVLIDARKIITKPQVYGILDTIRTRLLDFILELEESFPELIGNESDLSKIPESAVTNHFHTIISGNKNIVNTGSTISQNINELVIENDFKSLKSTLSNFGISKIELEQLESSINEDGKLKQNKKFGNKVASWVGKITEKAVSGSIEIASKEGTSAIIKALSDYYGFG